MLATLIRRKSSRWLLFAAVSLFAASYLLPAVAGWNVEKLAQFIRLFSAFFAWLLVVQTLSGSARSSWVRENSFPVAIATGSTFLLIGYRVLSGAGLGLHPISADTIASGFLYYPEDNYEYAAFAAQAAETGAFLFHNPFTLEPHRPLYFNPFFLAAGWIARIFGVSVIPIMIACGIIASMLLLLLVYRICRSMDLPETACKWATLLAAFSSGSSLFAYYAGRSLGISVAAGSDLRFLDSILFSTFYALPYQSISYFLQGVVVLLLVKAETTNGGVRLFFWLALAQLLSAFTRPYEWFLLLSGYGIYTAFSAKFGRKQITILLILGMSTAPALLYNWWLSHQEVWKHFAEMSMSQQKFRLYWVVGYGLVGALSVVGSLVVWKDDLFRKARWVAAAALLAILLLMIVNIPQSKLASCSPLFLCITAGVGIHWIRKRLNRVVGAIIAVPACVLLFGGSLFLMLAYFRTDAIDSELLEIAGRIPPGSRILSDEKDGNLLPVFTASNVYSGQWSMTPGYAREKRNMLMEAGFLPGGHSNPTVLLSLVHSEKIDFVVTPKSSPADRHIRNSPEAILVDCYARRCVFKIEQEQR